MQKKVEPLESVAGARHLVALRGKSPPAPTWLLLSIAVCFSTALPVTASATQSIEEKRQAFDARIAQRRLAFDTLLQQRWQQFDAQIEARQFTKPKLITPPTFPPGSPAPTVRPPPAPPKPTTPTRPTEPTTRPERTIDFFGQQLSFSAPGSGAADGITPAPTAQGISNALPDYWNKWSQYEMHLATELLRMQRTLALDDWVSFQLVLAVVERMYPGSESARVLPTWKFLNRLGYDARVASSRGDLVLLLPFDRKVFGTPSYEIEGKHYYAIMNYQRRSRVSTYPGVASGRRSLTQFSPGQINWPSSTNTAVDAYEHTRVLTAKRKTPAALTMHYDQRDVSALASYPEFDFNFYFEHPTRSILDRGLTDQLKSLSATEHGRASELLKLMQYGLQYQTDQQQFGKENYLFGDETIAFPAADCEDRSILFAGLLKAHLGIDYVVLLYPGHLSVAIDVPGSGDSVSHNGRRYLVADPTYFGAPIGLEMTQYRNRGKVIYASKD